MGGDEERYPLSSNCLGVIKKKGHTIFLIFFVCCEIPDMAKVSNIPHSIFHICGCFHQKLRINDENFDEISILSLNKNRNNKFQHK